jgi:hypothetical protein
MRKCNKYGWIKMGIMHDLGNWSYGRGSCAYVDMVRWHL